MINTVAEFNEFGVCKIDVDKVIKRWSLLCRVYEIGDKYHLVEYTPKGKRKLKIEISKEDASKIIKAINLEGVKNNIFKNNTTYLKI